MILKITLETEKPWRILPFLEENDYFRSYPLSQEDPSEWIRQNKRYRDIVQDRIKLPDPMEDGETAVSFLISEEDQNWICGIVREAFYQFTDDEYERGCFSVEFVNACTEEWGNGKDFYVFTHSYSQKPVLNF